MIGIVSAFPYVCMNAFKTIKMLTKLLQSGIAFHRNCLKVTFLFFLVLISAQNAFALYTNFSDSTEGRTFAVIVGISSYQSQDIPRLRFAHNDAIHYKEYLISNGVDSGDITMLLNEQATRYNIMIALYGLCIEKAKKGDKIYFYFSGHGDVESAMEFSTGYLLPHDSPAKVYAIGAIDVRQIQDYISNASSRGIQCILMVDACHSGNLAGGTEGSINIQKVLGTNWKDEIKILSCQPGEFSLEGTQWGNGRGVFSYFFINGIAGEADRNSDEHVTLNELSLYLNQKVPEAVPENPQYPVIRGNMQTRISKVNREFLAKHGGMEVKNLTKIDLKGRDDILLQHLDDTVKLNYRLFNAYLDSGLTVNNNSLPSAYYYYKKMPETASTKFVTQLMKHNLGAELMNAMNSKLTKLVDNKKIIYNLDEFQKLALEGSVIRDVLGDSLLNSLGFLPNAIFQESLTGLLTREDDAKKAGIKKLDTCIAINPYGSHFYYMRGQFHLLTRNYNRAIDDEVKALEHSPTFLMPYLVLAASYSEMGNTDTAITILNKVMDMDSTFTFIALNGISLQHLKNKKYIKALKYFNKSRKLNNNLTDTIQRIDNNLFMAYSCYQLGMIRKAVYFYNEVNRTDKMNCTYPLLLASCHSLLRNKHLSLKYFELALKCGNIDFAELNKIRDLDYIRSTKNYKKLVETYSVKGNPKEIIN